MRDGVDHIQLLFPRRRLLHFLDLSKFTFGNPHILPPVAWLPQIRLGRVHIDLYFFLLAVRELELEDLFRASNVLSDFLVDAGLDRPVTD